MVMKKIFDGVFDEELHNDFLKFGRGQYWDKYLLTGKKQAKKWTIKTGPEYANFLVRKCIEKVDGKIKIKGVIVSTLDLKDEFEFDIKKVSNFQGVRKNIVDTEVKPEEILSLMDKYPKVFFGLSFKGKDFDLKVKAKAPTSGKPGKEKDGGPKADFCTLKTVDKDIVDEIFFDVTDWNEISVNHKITVDEIVYPSNMNELTPAQVREMAKRKGTVRRTADFDGDEKVSEANFIA